MILHDADIYMKRALDLARRGQGWVEPNPMVGAVVVQQDEIVGEGFHEMFGGPHAEVHALRQAGKRAKGATLYVTLEPCCHQGKTPPCTEAVIAAGIRTVIIGGPDPNPLVAGKGIESLRSAGLEVHSGFYREAAEQLNAPFFKLMKTGKPYVIAKWAMTLDGKIATATGDSKWISNEASRAVVHHLRGRIDAIIVGIGTVLADNPLLTARPPGPRVPTRIVLDSRIRIPPESQLLATLKSAPLMLVHQVNEQPNQDFEMCPPDISASDLKLLGVDVLTINGTRTSMLKQLLEILGQRKMTNVMIEGGGRVLGTAFDADLVDEVWVFMSAKVVGSDKAPGPVAGQGLELIGDTNCWSPLETEELAGDVLLKTKRLRK
jgi:diaminohydroxyphosphoribosylaminopyrimidine deaminase/5-amino-6-(5-phosphoribosylamino)uracil reductase